MEKIQFKNNEAPYIDADNLNLMQDNIENAIQKNEVYSNEEQLIGIWVNGEPLYRKVIIFNDSINSSNKNEFAHGIKNADFVRVKEAHLYELSSGRSLPIPITLYGSNTSFDHLNIEADRTNITFRVSSGWSTGWHKVVVLEYTKTTD